jgi:geranylgeranyl pyrophosphate synthase
VDNLQSDAVKQQLREVVLTLPGVANWPEMAQLWREATEQDRPDWQLPVLAMQAMSMDTFPEVTRVMAAVGCLQLSIILVDDMLDEDPRGAYVKWGGGTAANLAVAFQAAATQLVTNPVAQHILAEIGLKTAVGQRLSLSPQPDLAAYWQLVAAKSTPFYAGSLALGAAIFAANDAILRQQMYQVGALVGEIVQIRDDIFDAMESPASPDWQRPSGNLLLLYGLLTEDAEFARLLKRVQADEEDTALLDAAQNHLINLGAVAYALEAATERQTAALALLEKMRLPNPAPLLQLVNEQMLGLDQLI